MNTHLWLVLAVLVALALLYLIVDPPDGGGYGGSV